ncbi:MAG: phage shock protein operon transcriptional activator [Marinicaulis sp.]|nr:phage shock protein operon transcriptional activator [Marinicaulis sp.]
MHSPPSPPDLIGQSPIFLDALAHASAAASVDRPILVIGERGSGKELFAARIHFLSPRWEGPFIKVNCAAMSEELLDSELFGHEAGAFIGAAKKHRGRFERAEGGTLFLDEISSASLRVQEKLLRVIEYGEYERVGGEQTITADVRIVAAANVNLPARAEAGKFRADLLDRLAFDVVIAPPLRKRREDIAQLAAHFANGMASELSERFPGFTPEALHTLQSYSWPGNVRELKNAAERAMFHWSSAEESGPIEKIILDPFDQGEALAPDLAMPASEAERDKPSEMIDFGAKFDLRAKLDEIEKTLVTDALARSTGNQKRTAEALCLTYDQMRGLVRKYDLAGGS